MRLRQLSYAQVCEFDRILLVEILNDSYLNITLSNKLVRNGNILIGNLEEYIFFIVNILLILGILN